MRNAPTAKPKKQQRTRDCGRVLVLAPRGFCGDHPDSERGPLALISDRAYSWGTVLDDVVLLAAAYTGNFWGIKFKRERPNTDRILVISPFGLKDHHFLSSFGNREDMTFAVAARAHRQIKWIESIARGPDLVEYLRRAIAIAAPDMVVISPMEYFRLSARYAQNQFLNDIGWRLPPTERPGHSTALDRYHDPYDDGHEDPRDWGDWWKKGGR